MRALSYVSEGGLSACRAQVDLQRHYACMALCHLEDFAKPELKCTMCHLWRSMQCGTGGIADIYVPSGRCGGDRNASCCQDKEKLASAGHSVLLSGYAGQRGRPPLTGQHIAQRL